jgi:hypothetical protein
MFRSHSRTFNSDARNFKRQLCDIFSRQSAALTGLGWIDVSLRKSRASVARGYDDERFIPSPQAFQARKHLANLAILLFERGLRESEDSSLYLPTSDLWLLENLPSGFAAQNVNSSLV